MITLLLIAISIALVGRAVLEVSSGSRAWLESRLRWLEGLRLPGRASGRSFGDLIDSLGTRSRLRRAGLEDRVPLQSFIAAKTCCAACGGLAAVGVLGIGPCRPLAVLAATLPVAGFLLPDAIVETIARKRIREIRNSLAGALEVAASGVGGGREPLMALASGAGEGSVLAHELKAALAQTDCGVTRRTALQQLSERVPSAEVSVLVAALDRSARFGSPLGDRLRQQAETLRRSQRRRIAEGAARSAPRIQLVVALVLVPSVLLLVAAGLLANLGSMLSGS